MFSRHVFAFWLFALFSSLIFAEDSVKLECAQLLRAVVIVDPYFATGSKIATTASANGIVPISIRSTQAWPDGARESFSATDFAIRLVNDGDFTQLEKRLVEAAHAAGLKIEAVIAGSDTGVHLQDQFNQSLNLPGNNLQTSASRYDKAATGAALRAKGVRAVAEYEAKKMTDALTWAREHNKWPIIMKPTMSSGSDGLVICHNFEDVKRAFKSIFGQRNQMKMINESVLMQEYISGPQFIVNTLNYVVARADGSKVQVRQITDIWHQVRDAEQYPTYVYDHNIMLPFEGVAQDALRVYNEAVLKAVDFQVGVSHLEIILTPDGPVLIDLNPRLPGAGMPMLTKEATGFDMIAGALNAQMGLLIDEHPKPYVVNATPAVVYIRSKGTGGRMSHRLAATFEDLKRAGLVLSYKFNFPEGKPLNLSKDSDTIVAKIEVLNADTDQVLRLIKQIRQWEIDRLFER